MKKQHSTSLLDLKLLANSHVIWKVHFGLNQSRGHDLDGIPEEVSQGVVSVKRFIKKRNDIIEPTHTYLLTFGMSTLPTNIKVVSYEN